MGRPKLMLVRDLQRPPSRLDWATVEQAMASTGSNDEPRTLKFQRLVLDKLLGFSHLDADDHITDGGDDCGVDAFVIDYNNNKLHLISTKTVEAFDKAKNNFPGREVSTLICFVRDFVDHIETLLVRCNPLLRGKIVEAWDAISGGRVFQICVHLCSNQSQLMERDARALREALAELKTTVFEHHLTRLSDEVSRNWSPPVSKTLSFVEKELFEHSEEHSTVNGSNKSLVGCVRVRELCALLREERHNFIDENLFHANVRGHLGIQNPVNREIAQTLREPNNSRFFCLNNGITIVCEQYFYQSGGFPVTLHRPQIVNGRQTTETIFAAYRQDPTGVGEVTVTVRVIQTSDPDFIEEVSVATNSQSRIGSRDLRANSAIARKLAAGLERLGYCYVRKRGEKSCQTAEKTIDALKAGQLILAYLRGLPEKAKIETSSMFGDDFNSVFDPHQVTPELLVAAHRLFGEIEQEKQRARLSMRQSGLSAASAEHWLVEGAFHVLYCVGLAAAKNNLDIANYDLCVPLIAPAMEIVGRYFDGAQRIAAYRLFRSVKAREDLKQLVLGERDFDLPRTQQYRFGF